MNGPDKNTSAQARPERLTGIELLRILCMLMIVAGHSFTHGGFATIPFSLNGIFTLFLSQGARIAVDVFFLITGYFMVSSSISITKLKRIYFQIWSYSVVIGSIFLISSKVEVGKDILLRTLMPITSSTYWFATDYFLILLLIPALKIVVVNLPKRIYFWILACFGMLWCVLPSLYIGAPAYSEFGWSVYVVLFGAYLHQYLPVRMQKIRAWHGLFLLMSIMILTATTYYLGYNILFFRVNAVYIFGGMNSVSGFICSIFLFQGFLNSNIAANKCINRVAACTFGVYLFHDNPLMREYIWQDLFRNNILINDGSFIPRMIISIVGVFIVGIMIEYLRQNLLDKLGKRSKKHD